MPSDLTVLPKFWTPSSQSPHDMIIITKANKGFGGVCSTKRGLATRAWTDHVAALRKAVMAGDNRITMEKICGGAPSYTAIHGVAPGLGAKRYHLRYQESDRPRPNSVEGVSPEWGLRLDFIVREEAQHHDLHN